MRRCSLQAASALLLALLLRASSLHAQLEPPSAGGIVARDRALRMLGHERRVLVIGAHPDDEDTELLTVLVRGMGSEAAYLSLNRGEGGQNLIGPELGEALGLLRTEELLAARRLDGATQFFTRAYDFGFSKSQAETWTHWPQDSILKDVVRIIRRYRPQIVVSIFSGTPRDGHGQHQAAGWVTREAFRVAGDSMRFPELLREERLDPWAPLKLYRSTRFDTAATTLTLAGGVIDSAVGLSFHQIAMAGRSLHRSQDMGRLQQIGPSAVRLALVDDRTGRGASGLFAGVDTLLPPGPDQPDQRAHREAARAATAGILCDARSDDDRVVAGQTLHLVLECWNTSALSRTVTASLTTAPGFASSTPSSVRLQLAPNALDSATVTLRVSETAPLTAPYFSLPTGEAAMYDWSHAAPAVRGLPFEPPALRATFAVDTAFTLAREVSYRFDDQAHGEVRRPVVVVPRIAIELDPANEVWSTSAPMLHRFTVTLTHGARDTTAGTVTLVVPHGWAAVGPRPFRFTTDGEREVFEFDLRPPAVPQRGPIEIRAVARDLAGRRYDTTSVIVDYPHVRPRWFVQSATSVVRTTALTLPRLQRVGYVRGAADRVPEALRSVGVPLTLLDAAALDRGDLTRYQAIIVGPRAFETDSALVENNGRLLEYARQGGVVIVQYQQARYFEGRFAPFPMTLHDPHDRVTDETAPVTVLNPRSPVTRLPNRLGLDDWKGWIQERGLYFARSWDAAYHPVFEMHDPGEQPLEGGLLVATVGKGRYVYTGLSFFRQLPAGVPGAYRLFANILALAALP